MTSERGPYDNVSNSCIIKMRSAAPQTSLSNLSFKNTPPHLLVAIKHGRTWKVIVLKSDGGQTYLILQLLVHSFLIIIVLELLHIKDEEEEEEDKGAAGGGGEIGGG